MIRGVVTGVSAGTTVITYMFTDGLHGYTGSDGECHPRANNGYGQCVHRADDSPGAMR